MKRLHLHVWGVSLVLFMALSACSVATQHAATPILSPLLEEKDDFALSLHSSTYDFSRSYDFQGAYAVSDHWALSASASQHRGRPYEEFGTIHNAGLDGMDGFELHLGGGYFDRVGRAGLFELYGGLTHLWGHNRYGVSGESHFRSFGLFLQPGWAWNISDVFTVSMGTRLHYSNYYRVDHRPSTNGSSSSVWLDLGVLRETTPAIFLEPHLTLRLGYQYVKFQAQLRRSYEFSSAPLAYSRNGISLGLVFDFKPRFKRQIPASAQLRP